MNWRPARENRGHQEAQDKVLMIPEKSGKPTEGLLAVPDGSAFGTSHRNTRIR